MHTRITTGKPTTTPHGTHHIDASTLPNPYAEKGPGPRRVYFPGARP
ncbi:TPA: hypothetical protein OUB66_002599, partial [Corynebacterium aurimucosum]|nr:hypothetical protein [Corynebacterium aurimucosum]